MKSLTEYLSMLSLLLEHAPQSKYHWLGGDY
jgi:hypothetical protein